MSSLTTAFLIFACVFSGALAGMWVREWLPDHHLDDPTKDVVKLASALIGTMGALVLGLMIGSAKASYDTRANGVAQMAAHIVHLDRVLVHYGPGAAEPRAFLRQSVTGAVERFWPADGRSGQMTEPNEAIDVQMYDMVQRLPAADARQQALQTRAASIVLDMGQLRSTLFQRSEATIPTVLLVFLVFWFTIIFFSFGLFAPRHTTVVCMFLLGATALAGALYLILEFDRSFDGVLKVSGGPLRAALAQISR